MKDKDWEKKILGEFFERFVPSGGRAVFRIVFGENPHVSDLACVKDRVVEDIDIVEELQPILSQWVEFKRAEISEEIGPDKRMPKLIIFDVHASGQCQRYEYNDPNALSVSKSDLGKPNSYYHPNTIILPHDVTEKAKATFSAGKEVESEWALSAYGVASQTVSMSTLRWDKWLRSVKKPTTEKWLLQNPTRSNHSTLSKISGLKLTLYKDGTFYDEAVDKSLDIQWVNNDGELNDYHWVTHGFVNAYNGAHFLVPTEHSSLGTPEQAELQYVRYNDYDTKVVDTLEIKGEFLYRCVSVLTSGVYLSRYMYVYSRDGAR